jgi:DNA-binding beta-propeller fold protein YncE
MKATIFIILNLLTGLMLNAAINEFRSPVEVAYSPDGKWIASTDFTHGTVYFIDTEHQEIKKEVTGLDRPFDLVWLSDHQVAVSEYGSHFISIIDTRRFIVINSIPCVKYPMGIAKINNERIIVTGFGKSEVGVVDTKLGRQVKVLPVWYQPNFVAVTPDQKKALVSNLTPKSSDNGAMITIVDLISGKNVKNVELLFGTSNVRHIVTSPDGKWAYVAHTYGKVMLPTTQIERGWINTNVLSIIDIEKGALYATVPFDFVIRGAADPWGLVLSVDGTRLYATLAGVNELAILKLDILHKYLSGEDRPKNLRSSDANAEIAKNIWDKVYDDPSKRIILADQFAALFAANLLERIKIPLQGPRGLDISPDGQTVSVSGYYSGNIVLVDAKSGKTNKNITTGEVPEMTLAREGEMLFHDAGVTLQSWLSCVTCHPAGRADGLNWDLLNDGIGNPKNAKSLLLAHATPPSMSTGIRGNYEIAVEKGFHFIQFNEAGDEITKPVKAYLAAMQPDKSPYLDEYGQLTAKALKGKEIFENEKVGCIKCHHGPYFTDLKMYDVGTKGKYSRTNSFDNPTLIEVWRTAPYLHDGSAKTLKEVFTTGNAEDKHGKTSHLNEEEIDALIEYVNSL